MRRSDVDELLSKLTAEMAIAGRKEPYVQLARAELFTALMTFIDKFGFHTTWDDDRSHDPNK